MAKILDKERVKRDGGKLVENLLSHTELQEKT